MRFIDQFHHRVVGPSGAPKIVFLHGLMGFLNNWGSVARRLQDHFQILVYDQRGHGQSIKPKTDYHPNDYALDLYQILNDLQWSKIHLVGHSMGGRNALYFADKYSNHLKSLTIEDIGPESEPNQGLYYQNLLNSIPVPFENRDQMTRFFESEFTARYHEKEQIQVLIPFLKANLVQQDDGKWDWRFFKNGIVESVQQGRAQDAWGPIERLKIPTLYLRGEWSRDLSPDTFQKVLSLNPRIKGVTISDAGHWIHYDQPEAFTNQIRCFIEQIEELR